MSNNYAISLKRSTALLAALAFFGLLTVVNFASFLTGNADAATLATRSLTLSSTLAGTETTGTAGSATRGSAATHDLTFTLSDTVSVASAYLQYCTDPLSDNCTAPTGLDLNPSATLGAATNFPGAALGTTTDNTAIVTFTAHTTAAARTISLENVINPTNLGTFFVRISLHSDGTPDTGGMADVVHEGSVASSITEGIEITARVKETLGFSTTGAVTTADNGIGVPGSTCAPLTGTGAITLGDPIENALSLNDTYSNYSAFRTYTNAGNGMSITYEGATLTSGTNDIDAAGGTAASFVTPGTEQFGLAVDGAVGTNSDVEVNSLPTPGTADFANANVAADWAGGAGNLSIATDYQNGATDSYAFVADAPTIIASSTSYVDCTTVPVRYAANIEPLTTPGVYTTTVVYTAVPRY